MKIEGMGNQYAFGLQGERKNRAESEKVSSAMQRQEQPTGVPEQAKIARSHHANGAIGNLQEAHFQGVASLRLQINFQVQLQANAIQKADDILETGSDQLVTDLGDQITTLGTDFQGSFAESDIIAKMQGLMDTFSQAVSNLFGESEETGSATTSGYSSVSQPGDILVGIQGAFGDFFDGMWQLAEPSLDEPVVEVTDMAPVLAVASTELPITPTVSSADEVEGIVNEGNGAAVDGIVAAETADVPENTPMVPSFTDRLTDLQTWFDSQIASLQYSVDELMNLPPIGHQRGQGMAYSRFLAIYTEMNSTASITQAGDDMLPEGGVETEA